MPKLTKLLHKSVYGEVDVYGHKHRHDAVVLYYEIEHRVRFIEAVFAFRRRPVITTYYRLFCSVCYGLSTENRETIRFSVNSGTSGTFIICLQTGLSRSLSYRHTK